MQHFESCFPYLFSVCCCRKHFAFDVSIDRFAVNEEKRSDSSDCLFDEIEYIICCEMCAYLCKTSRTTGATIWPFSSVSSAIEKKDFELVIQLFLRKYIAIYRTWMVSLSDLAKQRQQIEQTNGRSPVCFLKQEIFISN